MYNLVRPNVDFTTEWLDRFNKIRNTYSKVIGKWWILNKQFKARDNVVYPTHLMREPYCYATQMICRLNDTKFASHCKEEL